MHPTTVSPASRLRVESFFDPATFTFSHLLRDHATGQCALIDSVLDYDPNSGRTGTRSADRLIERVRELGLQVQALHTPGHTPACMTYVVRDPGADPVHIVAFVGDTLFMPDYGTARCDFPGGSAATLYRSIRKVLALPDDTTLYLCHDYPPDGREPQCVTTVADQKQSNIHVREGLDEADFVAMREQRDAGLPMPVLILPSVQVNMRAGKMPPPEDNGVSYLKIPVNAL